jgi:hypothetical protein
VDCNRPLRRDLVVFDGLRRRDQSSVDCRPAGAISPFSLQAESFLPCRCFARDFPFVCVGHGRHDGHGAGPKRGETQSYALVGIDLFP